MALPYSSDVTTVEVQGVLVSQPYVAMTLSVMEAFGVTIGNRKFRRFDIYPARYRGRDYAIEPDASAASYFFALAAITGGSITVEGLGHVEHPGGHGVRGRPRAHGLHGRATSPRGRPSRPAGCAQSTST